MSIAFKRVGIKSCCCTLIASLLLAATPAIAATPDEVSAAIDKGKTYLYTRLQANGNVNWETAQVRGPINDDATLTGSQFGGLTSIATYALLASGEDENKLAAPIGFLRKAEIVGVYALGLRCQVWHLVKPTVENRGAMLRDAKLLNKGIKANGNFDYTVVLPTGEAYDHSVSQYGVLGMWACAQEGAEFNIKQWKQIDSTWRARQLDDGSWGYDRGAPPKNTQMPNVQMTAAGIASLFISRDQIIASVEAKECKGNIPDPNIERGLAWLSKHFPEVLAGGGWNYYALYGISRIGVAGGVKYIGDNDWYAKGAETIVRSQQPDGRWGGGGDESIYDTALCMLFLARGSAPVIMNKLQYTIDAGGKTTDGNWNQRPRDLYELSIWIGSQVEEGKNLNWQVVNLDAPVDDLHDAPILYVCGDQALSFSDVQQQKLKKYVEQGGLILCNADCASKAFTDSVKKLAPKLFADEGFGEFRELPPEHPLYKNQQYPRTGWGTPPHVLGVSNGVREVMLLLPNSDVSRYWQGNMYRTHLVDFQLGADILQYAVDKKNLHAKGSTFIVEADRAIVATKKIKVARIQYKGVWNPEAGGWVRVAAIMHNTSKIDLDVQPVDITKPDALKGFQVAHLTGVDHLRLNGDALKQITDFVQAGGTLIVDAAGGSQTFATDALAQLKDAFGKDADQLNADIPMTSPFYTQTEPKLDRYTFRNFAKKTLSSTRNPHIRGLTVGNRIAVFFSAEDLSGGIVGEPVDGIVGYDPDSATALIQKMLVYATTPPAAGNPPVNPPANPPVVPPVVPPPAK